MERQDNKNCPASSGTATIAASVDDEIRMSSKYEPLPLSSFKTYYELVIAIYGTSLPVILGNSLEWIDFSIYGYSSVEISSQLFGGSKSAYWVSFGLGFAMRPLGAFVLGKLSDKESRKFSFIVSMLAMSTSTAIMSLIPAVCNTTKETFTTYCVSNIWLSAIPAICLRCVQGFSAGAAAGGVNVIQSELWSTTERKGAIVQSVGVQNVSGGGASMISAAVVYGLRTVIGGVRYEIWGWRVAFLIVVPPSLFASYLTYEFMPESNVFVKCDGKVKEHASLVENVIDDRNEGIAKSVDESRATPNSIDCIKDTFVDEDGRIDVSRDRCDTPCKREKFCDHGQSSLSSPQSLLVECISPSNNNSGNLGDDNHSELETTNSIPWWLLISVIIFSQFAISGFNNLTVFLVEFAQKNYNVSVNASTLMQVTGKAVQVLMTPVAATLGDIKGWHWTCAFGGTLCTVLALPMMVAGDFGGVTTAW
eukprot:CAMPEP_0197188934 /NCGR_PEP_ID=MMETSP1423-20130617/18817_1 /TAXON_ID=476441 /ORGANISM="Pseudo-nitzschia heimii, Strain UNC1101" /LENGTH=477 /DNA_ID=CAMNT_0042640923 /DNA_START=146 /DNA_END=1576 /DNA_ORIENTATION=-